ncbi:hypothetical protein [Arcobacter sp. FWKO B]|uniref:hypothetical protein n=1 Tax=Arcobacter sp. FWKO B TaxID=2593672 RepID=UPI0018A67DFC|nr:hypothetical protein [Arcobacter sp. FWKO B]QOG11164.1 hypothetical protein FWKOB_00015 [Arcobacter sp. FWKO B]
MIQEEKNQVLFSIENSSYIAKAISYLIGGIVGYLLITYDYDSTRASYNFYYILAISSIFFGLFKLIKYKQNKEQIRIILTKNEIIFPLEKLNLKNIEIKEIYRISPIIFEGLLKLRIIFLLKALLIIAFPIIFLLSTIIHLAKSIYYRKKFQFYDYLVLIGKNDKEVIKIQIPLQDEEEQKNLEAYCKEYLNTDINQLKRLWFIPERKYEDIK